jgi:methionine-rich copper-binding protein CopC
MKIPTAAIPLIRAAMATLAPCTAQFAFAHAHPKTQTPAPGASLSSAAAEVSIVFDDAIAVAHDGHRTSGHYTFTVK